MCMEEFKDSEEVAYRRQRSTGTKTPPDGGEAQKCANPRLVLDKGAKAPQGDYRK